MQQQLCLPLLLEFRIDLRATKSSMRNAYAAVKFSNLKCSSKPAMFMLMPAKPGTVKTNL